MNFFKKPLFPVLIAIYMLFFFTAPGISAMISSSANSDVQEAEMVRAGDIDKIQRALENKIVKEKLRVHGLTDEEIDKKLKNASDSQIHLLAQASDKVLAGGSILYILLVVLVVILIVKLI